MTVKLNLTIDEKIVAKSKQYAAQNKTSVSKMVQELLRKTIEGEAKSTKRKSFMENYAGVLSGKLSDARVEQIKKAHLAKKYES